MIEFLVKRSVRRPRLVVGVWVALFIIGGLLAGDAELGFESDATDFLNPGTTTEIKLGRGIEATRARDLLEDLRGPARIAETVIVQSDSLTVDDPEFRATVEEVYYDLTSLGSDVAAPGAHYYLTDPPALDLVSADRRTTIIPVLMTGDYQDAVENVEHVLAVVEEADGADDMRVLVVGEASIAHETTELAERDLRQGERVGVPVALIILVVLFGTIVAVIMPIGLALVVIVAALGMAALIGQAMELSVFVSLMIIMIGLAVGIDYSILIVSRFRQERARGLEVREAIERANAVAGHTVLFSGATVIIALIGMLIVPISLMQSLGLGAILVVLVALAATVTFLPACLMLLGPRLDSLPVPFLGKRTAPPASPVEDSGHGLWDRTTRIVMRHPAIAVAVVAVPMIVIILFYFQWPGIQTGINGVSALPEGAETREAFLVMEDEFSFGQVTPTDVVVRGDVRSPEAQEAMRELQALIAAPSRGASGARRHG